MKHKKDDFSGNVDMFFIDGDRLIPVNLRTEKKSKTPQEEMYGRLRW